MNELIKDYLMAVRYARLIKKYIKDNTLCFFYLKKLNDLHENEFEHHSQEVWTKLKESENNLNKEL